MGGITGILGWLLRARVFEASNSVMYCNCLESWWSLLLPASSKFGLIGLGFEEDFDCSENFMVWPTTTTSVDPTPTEIQRTKGLSCCFFASFFIWVSDDLAGDVIGQEGIGADLGYHGPWASFTYGANCNFFVFGGPISNKIYDTFHELSIIFFFFLIFFF